MPGIFGVIAARAGPEHEAVLHRMATVLMHEPFYAGGFHADPDLGVYVGWTDRSEATARALPARSDDGSASLVFSGEEFSGEGGGAEAADGSDPSCAGRLVEGYRRSGRAFLAGLNGWFAGLLVDARLRESCLFTDRYGLGRLYYHRRGRDFYFASEAKALLAVLPELRRFDASSLGELFSCGAVLGNRTLFQGVSLVPAGTAWRFPRPGEPVLERYFDPAALEAQAPLEPEAFQEALEASFRSILPRYLRGPQGAVGMSLTGGLDGRMIMAWADPREGTLPCYTFGGPYRDCADVRIARRVAKICRQPHQVLPVGKDFLAEFPRLAERAVYVSDGTMDVGGSVELYVNRFARAIAPVRLTGNYGSEVMRGNVAFRPRAVRRAMLDPGFAPCVDHAVATYAQERRGGALSFVAFKQVPWHHYARLSVEASQLTLRSPYLDNELVALMYRAPLPWGAGPEPALRLVAAGNTQLASIPTDRGVTLDPVPLATRAYAAFQQFTAKAEYAYDYGMPQWVARADHALAPLHLERLFLGRHKFYHFRVWYRDQLAAYVRDVLLDPRSLARPYLDARTVRDMVTRHTAGTANFTSEIHRLLSLELSQRQLFEAP